jgi:hypothetical protein
MKKTTQTLWKLLRKHGVDLYTAQKICNEAMISGVTVPTIDWDFSNLQADRDFMSALSPALRTGGDK